MGDKAKAFWLPYAKKRLPATAVSNAGSRSCSSKCFIAMAVQLLSLLLAVAILVTCIAGRMPTWDSGDSDANPMGLMGRAAPSAAAKRFDIFPRTEQEDLFISVKTTGKFHRSRLDVVVATWFQLAREQIWFFTDVEDAEMDSKTSELRAITARSGIESSDDQHLVLPFQMVT